MADPMAPQLQLYSPPGTHIMARVGARCGAGTILVAAWGFRGLCGVIFWGSFGARDGGIQGSTGGDRSCVRVRRRDSVGERGSVCMLFGMRDSVNVYMH